MIGNSKSLDFEPVYMYRKWQKLPVTRIENMAVNG